jgi:hypothetical protein
MVRREFTSKIDVPVCAGLTRADMMQVLRQIKGDQDTRISLTAN